MLTNVFFVDLSYDFLVIADMGKEVSQNSSFKLRDFEGYIYISLAFAIRIDKGQLGINLYYTSFEI